MSYVNTDFDNLNAGINILNIVESETTLLPYEGTYSDKGKGYKQQYMTLMEDKFDPPHLYLDFCFIFKDGFTTTNVTNIYFNSSSILNVATPTITSDSNNNVVWLFENVNSWSLHEFFDQASYFQWYIGNNDYHYTLHSSFEVDNKQPDEFDIVKFYPTRQNITFEAHRDAPTSSDLVITFNGTYYNGSLGIVNNAIQTIEIYHFDDLDNKVVDKTLVQNTDYTANNGVVYSGTSSVATPITISSGILYNQKNEVFLKFETTAEVSFGSYMITKGIPICNWKQGEFYVNGDLILCDEDGDNPVNLSRKARETVATQYTSDFTTTGTTAVSLTNMYKSITTYGGDALVNVSLPISVDNRMAFVDLYVDGTKKAEVIQTNAHSKMYIFGQYVVKNLSSGSHTFELKVRAQNNADTVTIHNYNQISMVIVEI